MHARARKSRVSRLVVVIFLVTLSVVEGPPPAWAQPDLESKYNPLLKRELGAVKPSLKTLGAVRSTAAGPKIKLMLRVAPGTTKEDLRALDPSFYIGTVSGGVATAEIPQSLVSKLAASPKVLRLTPAFKYKPLNDVTRSSTTSSGLFLGVLSTAGVSSLGTFDGTGVVIGDVDTGIDFRHQDFVNGSGGSATTRLLSVWDQTDSGGPAPTGFNCPSVAGVTDCGGTEWTAAQLTSDIRGQSSQVRQVDSEGHGTAVLGCAGGSGLATNGNEPSGKYKGMAPNADLVMVKSDLSDAGICDGVSYIFDRATAAGKPVVANLSLGGHLGPHDGTSDMETCLTGLTGAGKIIVASAGNEGFYSMHATRTGTGTINWTKNGIGLEYIDFWYNAATTNSFNFSLTATDQSCGTLSVTAGNMLEPVSANFCGATITIYNEPTAFGGNVTGGSGTTAGEILVIIEDTPTDPVDYVFTFTQTAGSSARIDGWVVIDATNNTFNSPEFARLVGLPGTSPGIITVGAYTVKTSWRNVSGGTSSFPNFGNAGLISTFSSPGPTRDGRVKPDIAAPGNKIQTSMSSNATVSSGDIAFDSKHMAISGTSFSSPYTAGIVALRLQQNPSLTTAQALAALQATARGDSQASGLPNSTWGSGKVLGTPPAYPAPTGLSAVALSASSIRWSYTDISNEEGYRLRRTTDNAFLGSVGAGVTQIDQTGLGPNASQQAYVEAFNLAGSSTGLSVTRFTQAAVPAAPTIVGVTSGSVTVSYGMATNPSGTNVELSASNDGFVSNFSTPTAFASVTGTVTTGISGLLAGTTYSFRLRARNSDSIVTTFSTTASTMTDIAIPPAVTVTGTAQGVSSITWTWGVAPSATAYNLTDGAAASLGSTSGTSLTRTGLSANTSYGLKVQGTNSLGTAPVSNLSALFTRAADPSAPALAAVGVSSLTISWNGGGNPAGTIFSAELSANGFASVIGSSRTVAAAATFSGLGPDANYSLRVKSENGDGVTGAYAVLPTTPTLAAVPSGLTLSQLSTSSLHAAWSANGNPFDTQYEVSLSTDAFTALISTPVAFAAVTATDLAGLTAGSTYFARVRARNRAGVATDFATASFLMPADLTRAVDPGTALNIVFGNVTLDVPAAAFSGSVNLTLHAPASFPSPASPAGTLTGTSVGVDILTDAGQQPVGLLDLTMSYTTLPPGVTDDQLVIARYEPARGLWVPLPSTPNAATKKVTARLNHLSLYQVMALTPAASLASAAIVVFPNPLYTSRGQAMQITGLPTGATVKIYTYRGDLVRSLTAGGSVAVWDGKNSGGSPAASGVYLALIKSGGDTKTVKIMVER